MDVAIPESLLVVFPSLYLQFLVLEPFALVDWQVPLCGYVALCGGLAAGRISEGYLPLSRMKVNSLLTLCFVYTLLLPCDFFSTSLYLQTRLNGLGASLH